MQGTDYARAVLFPFVNSLSLNVCVRGPVARGRLCRSQHTSVGREVSEQGDGTVDLGMVPSGRCGVY